MRPIAGKNTSCSEQRRAAQLDARAPRPQARRASDRRPASARARAHHRPAATRTHKSCARRPRARSASRPARSRRARRARDARTASSPESRTARTPTPDRRSTARRRETIPPCPRRAGTICGHRSSSPVHCSIRREAKRSPQASFMRELSKPLPISQGRRRGIHGRTGPGARRAAIEVESSLFALCSESWPPF